MKYTARFILSVLFLLIAGNSTIAQDKHYLNFFINLEYPINDSIGKLRILQDESVERIVLKHLGNNRNQGVAGYRIRIFSGIGTDAQREWNRLTVELEQNYNIGIYKQYDAPYYKLYIGDFRTYSEAYRFSKSIESHYDPLISQTDNINIQRNKD